MSFGAFNPKMRHSDNGDELIQIALESLEEWEGGPKGPIRMQPCFDGLVSMWFLLFDTGRLKFVLYR